MGTQREVWFRTSAIRGFGTVHWKGPAFIVAMSIVGIAGALLALTVEHTHPVLATGGVLASVGAIVVGNRVCGLHTERGS